MTELPPADIERRLAELSERIDFPATPPLAVAASARIAAAPPRSASAWSRLPRPRPQPLFVTGLLAVVLLIAAVLLGLSSGAREVVADRLGIGGVDIDIAPTATLSPLGADLALGTRTTLSAAESGLGFLPAGPPVTLYGAPEDVYVGDLPAGKAISYVYRPRDGLPEVGASGVGMLIIQFEGDTDAAFFGKQLDASQLEVVTVGGWSGVWISGAPHVFYYKDAQGVIQQETLRLAGNVLIWEANGVTLRIESALGRDEAIRIAEAMTTATP